MATILIADDQPMNRQYLATLLAYFGHRLLEASNGEEALRIAKSEHPALVISDLLMPVVDGRELARRLRKDAELAGIPVLLYSATYSLQQAQAVAREVGARDVLPKPGDPQIVLNMVHQALGISTPGATAHAGAASPPLLSPDFGKKLSELETIIQKLATPLEMSLTLAAERDPLRLLLGLARMTRELVAATYASIGLQSEDRQYVRVILSSGAGEPETESASSAGPEPFIYPAPPRHSPLGALLVEQCAVRLRDVDAGEILLHVPGCSRVDSFLGVPLTSGANPRGWLFVANKLGADEFTEADALVIATLGAQGLSAYDKVYERLLGEEELRNSKATFEALLEAAPDAMLAVDRAGIVRSANSQTQRMFQYPRQEIVGQSIDKLVPDRFRTAHSALRATYSIDPDLRPMGTGLDLYGRRKDGTEFPVDVMLSPLPASTGNQVLSVVRDISRRREAELRILELNRQLQARVEELQTANQSLETFSYSVSHDLRAPLRAIDGFARILSEDYKALLDDQALHLLDVIASNCHKMGKLIEDLLAFSRAGRGGVLRSEIDMADLARSVVEEFRASEPDRDIQVVVGDLPPAVADRTLVRQVLINLVSNGWKFTRRTPAAAVEIGAYRRDSRSVYFVKDNGVGFEPEYSHKLFGVFERLHSAEDFEGTGIGLALVHRIIQRHGGTVWATSKAGEGATFSFTLEPALEDS